MKFSTEQMSRIEDVSSTIQQEICHDVWIDKFSDASVHLADEFFGVCYTDEAVDAIEAEMWKVGCPKTSVKV